VELQNLMNLISSLSNEQQAAVEEFVKYLKQNPSPPTFREALDCFVREHPELLQRLAK
jgi:hypothetical protein